ncbi:MAG: glycosyltransferase [Lachnospiraceae bacterium]|nr:glycosyltransferase [Lachnospiraceae bacterium]
MGRTGHYLNKVVQATRTGGPAYAVYKVKRYMKRNLWRKKRFSMDDFVFEELPEPLSEQKDDNSSYDVSVVVPTYNAGTQFETMLELLEQQECCGTVEIVIVDSGSTDGTVQLCQQHEVTLVQIPNEQFSHSYARNLGAETAKGDILVFMTQDALPSSKEWLCSMIQPVQQKEADAVSCGEECPEGTDLYYRIANYGHASYVGFLQEDITGSREKCRDEESLRRYAALSDVACAIRRSLFLKFRHRFDFAEDQDLGIRLLAGGYRTRLLSGVKVLHGHNRSADYYLKRGLVDREAYDTIYQHKEEKEDGSITASTIYYSACTVAEFLSLVEEELRQETSVAAFIKKASGLFDVVIGKNWETAGFEKEVEKNAPLLEEIIRTCVESHKMVNYPSSRELAYSVRYYLDNVAEYFEYHGTESMKGLAGELCQCMWKQFALCVGAELVKLKQEEHWNCKIQELTKGV